MVHGENGVSALKRVERKKAPRDVIGCVITHHHRMEEKTAANSERTARQLSANPNRKIAQVSKYRTYETAIWRLIKISSI